MLALFVIGEARRALNFGEHRQAADTTPEGAKRPQDFSTADLAAASHARGYRLRSHHPQAQPLLCGVPPVGVFWTTRMLTQRPGLKQSYDADCRGFGSAVCPARYSACRP
jgi:hypothetical protein